MPYLNDSQTKTWFFFSKNVCFYSSSTSILYKSMCKHCIKCLQMTSIWKHEESLVNIWGMSSDTMKTIIHIAFHELTCDSNSLPPACYCYQNEYHGRGNTARLSINTLKKNHPVQVSALSFSLPHHWIQRLLSISCLPFCVLFRPRAVGHAGL